MRLIDADTLRAEFTGNFQELWHYTGIWAMIDLAPTIEAVPVVHAEWKYSRKEDVATCKNCSYEHYLGTYHQYATNFCPNCGADMRKKVE